MKVYIVEAVHEGGSVIGVYSNHKSAVEAALKVKCSFEGGWVKDEVDYWTNECDYVKIGEWEVRDL